MGEGRSERGECRASPVHPRKVTKIVRRTPTEKIFYFSGVRGERLDVRSWKVEVGRQRGEMRDEW